MTARGHRCATALTFLVTCGLVSAGGAGASSAAGGPDGSAATVAGPASGAPSPGVVRLSIPRPTGPHPVGVRSTFLHDPARTEPTTGGPRAIPVRVWYPAEEQHGPPAPYFSAAVQTRTA